MDSTTTSTSSIRTVSIADAERAVAVMSLAFCADPAARWTYPDPLQYWANMPDFVRSFGGKAFEHGTAYSTEDYRGSRCGFLQASTPTSRRLSCSFNEALRRTFATKCSPCSSRWAPTIRVSHTGICHSSVWIRNTTVMALDQRFCTTRSTCAIVTTN